MINEDNMLHDLLRVNTELNHAKDLDSLLDTILSEVRKIVKADAGSIFLLEDGKLDFKYVQNDTLSKRRDALNKLMIYSKFSLPLDETSIAGYVGVNAQPLAIDDVYNLDDSVPYSFNESFDKMSGYRTRSSLTVPMITAHDKVAGVIQIINAQDKDGNLIPFSKKSQDYVQFFATNATFAVERAKMTREMVLRMVKMAQLRDPKETGAHINRVGAYSIEIYQKWAENNNVPPAEIKKYKDLLRIAAMLHDVGKVAISDLILKKPGKLTNEEFEVIKDHPFHGAQLFEQQLSELDALCYEIAHSHHEKWNGTGYPQKLQGKNIPLSGRIVALADVYDALISARVYKPAWSEDKVLALISEESGCHFDPELVEAFLGIYDIITAIRNRYPD